MARRLRDHSDRLQTIGDWDGAQRCHEVVLARLRKVSHGPDPDHVALLLLDASLEDWRGDNPAAKVYHRDARIAGHTPAVGSRGVVADAHAGIMATWAFLDYSTRI